MKIAVLIPVYNAERHLPATLDSILAQTYPGVEIYALDDGSTDHAKDVIFDYAKRYPDRVHASAWENHGVGPTLNRLMDGLPNDVEAFSIADCDDYLHPEAIARLAEALERTEADVAECGIARVPNDAVAPEGLSTHLAEPEQVINDMSVYLLRRTAPGEWINYFNKLYRRKSVKDIRFQEGLDYEDDYWFGFNVNASIRRKVLLSAPLYGYRMNPEGVTSKVRFWQYVPSVALRIRLSCERFLKAGRVPKALEGEFLRELSKDAYRMIVRKNLKKNAEASSRREWFLKAGEALRRLESDYSFRPVGLNPVQAFAYTACRRGWYSTARLAVKLT